jgi:uncharacterized protein YjiS (DUF1127 family)
MQTVRSADRGLATRLEAALEMMRERLARYRRFRRTFAELNELTDRELSDLGLTRGMIRALARDAAR